MARELTDKQKLFVEKYLGEAELNATSAYLMAYSKCSEAAARRNASRLMTNADIQNAIKARRKELAASLNITPEKVLKKWWELATADANDLVEYRRDCCRHCWGIDHQYQWTEAEYEQAQSEAREKGDDSPSCAGGFGFISTRAPHPECPECQGEGRGKIHVHDTRRLKGAARELYNGVHQGKDGLKLLLRDRDKALEQVTKILGMYESPESKARIDEMHKLEVEAKRLAIAKAAKDLEDPNNLGLPEPKQIIIGVEDASLPDAE
ncbi:terminase small subunit [Chromobacterium haemolyticum]|uniref:terminase small subunit n=1 Tax=Chromobacterium haemolyticum TaxID=394935 RepID=UPI0013184699|nr:terminase small subunit [Chromobacterium haemolyticum]BBH11716.1 terminase small subunit [Chromobacterium haemolyticum]